MISVESVQQLNYILAVLCVGALVGAVVLFIDMRTRRYCAWLIEQFGLQLALIVATSGSLLTLVYSEIFGILPCGLCWFQRVALYPQIILIAVALYLKDRRMPVYGIALSIFGTIVALYQHYLQMGGTELFKCPATGVGADCAKRYIFEFGFMTFPLMAAILFVFLIALYMYLLRVNRALD